MHKHHFLFGFGINIIVDDHSEQEGLINCF